MPCIIIWILDCVEKAGLADHDNYHEFCRLLGRFRVNYQVDFCIILSPFVACLLSFISLSSDTANIRRHGLFGAEARYILWLRS